MNISHVQEEQQSISYYRSHEFYTVILMVDTREQVRETCRCKVKTNKTYAFRDRYVFL